MAIHRYAPYTAAAVHVRGCAVQLMPLDVTYGKKKTRDSRAQALSLAREEAKGVTDKPVFMWDMASYSFYRTSDWVELHIERHGNTTPAASVHLKTIDGNVSAGQVLWCA